MRSRIDQNEEDIERLEQENEQQDATLEGLTNVSNCQTQAIKSLRDRVAETEAWQKRHDRNERVLVVVTIALIILIIGTFMWAYSAG